LLRTCLGPQSSYLCLLISWNHRCMPPYLAYCWDGVSLTFAQAGLNPQSSSAAVTEITELT
jgi:hypothetical protein